ncbi:NADH-quinone oxidoreductase subunit NuoF [candidate division TA06 bacterium]|uniref:NADH-quinone oxidoreductase subunit NuoF n=1 Tax=candidate division TA06 bacterium TaxID=2250710 RepID=A0A523UUC7_UNCT6|nr:MAG: NADH-quinone oxidoreductase subunit NuoF [candidate division TA06 bacterium]
MRIQSLKNLEGMKKKGLRSLYPDETKVMVGMATCGLATGAKEVFEALKKEAEKRKQKILVTKTGCIGFCSREPLVDVVQKERPRITYGEVDAKKVPGLLDDLSEGKVSKEWVVGKMTEDECLAEGSKRRYFEGEEPEETREIPSYDELSFYKKQKKIATRNCGFIDPESIEEYIARGGYFSLHKVLTDMEPEQVIGDIKKSGLRGRGGAGFPTGLKWEISRKSRSGTKYIVCNADEGDPGAYMDRSILEGDPHTVLEGMIIGAYAIGASEGYIYCRTEYPLAIEELSIAIKKAREYGLLGKNIMGSGMDFDIKISEGAGAFVCGEETALMASIEGKTGEPRMRPPFPSESGLWGKPTNINNVETWANVPVIIGRGGDWYSKIGTKESKGTKVFSIVGKINNTGLVEVPMGITLKELVEDVGGGIPNNREFKAVQTGGPSGGCIPKSLLQLPVDYEELAKAGSIMGSGGLIVMDDETCMVDVAKYFIGFLEDESCGKCLSCREGTERMREILEDITEGRGKEGDIELLESLAAVVKDVSLCGLGSTAPNPVLSTIQYFRDEYEAHIKEKRCPARVCRALVQYRIDPEACTGCRACLTVCPEGAITGERKKAHVLDRKKCIKCGACVEVCKPDAIIVE